MPTGLQKANNTPALLSNAIALLVAWGNSGTSGEVDEDLMDHLRGCGRGCQLDVYAKIFYDLRHSALGASIQGDVAVFVPSEGRFVVARRPGEAALVHALRQKVQLDRRDGASTSTPSRPRVCGRGNDVVRSTSRRSTASRRWRGTPAKTTSTTSCATSATRTTSRSCPRSSNLGRRRGFLTNALYR